MTNHTKYKYTNVPSHLHISSLNSDKANLSFPHPFYLKGSKSSKSCTLNFG